MMALGFATAAAQMDFPPLYPRMVELTNHVISSDPRFIPYEVPTGADTIPSITCPRCGRTSFNRGDIRNRYCGYCHAFHSGSTQ
jgi:ribosomal protein S27AE